MYESVLTSPKMPQMLNPQDKTVSVVLSADLLDASAGDYFGSVRALEPVPTEGQHLYYYEAQLWSHKLMQIGWATKQCFFSDSNIDGIGDDRYSIGFDGSRGCIWHDGRHKIETVGWKEGDVLGCLIDLKGKNFVFYLNGKSFNVRSLNIPIHFSNLPYYPAASFQKSSASFNFGQQAFQFPPKQLLFHDFYNYRFNRNFQSLEPPPNWDNNVELSCDGLSVRNTSSDVGSIETVCGWMGVEGEGVYFYEVHLLTDGFMKIGWEGDGDSIGFDGYRKLIWNGTKQLDIATSCWKVDDVLGCLIDLTMSERPNYVFYHNGKEFDCSKLFDDLSSDNPKQIYKPAISLSAGQHVYCNFGQEYFRFEPKNIEFRDFCGNRFDRAIKEI